MKSEAQAHQEAVRQGFLAEAQAHPERISVVNAGRSVQATHEDVVREVRACLGSASADMKRRSKRSTARCAAAGWPTPIFLSVRPASVSAFSPSNWPKLLLCESRPADGRLEGCDHCPACAQVEAGTHPDFFTASRPPETAEFPISLMRELCQHFSLKAARGRGKVVVIDDADDLNAESANCFLKTLEEPPPGSVLILIGSSTDRQRQTIVSRCQVVRFRPLPPETVGEVLQANGVDDPTLRERSIQLGEGSPGQALALADPALWEFRRALLASIDAAAFRRSGVVEDLDGVRAGGGEGIGSSASSGQADAAAAHRLPAHRAGVWTK